MKQFIKTPLLAAAGLVLAALSANAQYNNNDLILGFQEASFSAGPPATYTGPNDYIIDLGSATSVGVGGSTVVTLTPDFTLSTFTGLYGSLSGGVQMGVVGGTPTGTSARTIFLTQFRATLGNTAVAGSTTPTTVSPTSDAQAIGSVSTMVGGLSLSPGHSTTTAPGGSDSWTMRIAPNQTIAPLPSFLSQTGRNPNAGVTSGSVLYEDLYQSSSASGAFTYRGFFTLDTANDLLTFTPAGFVAAVPEPTTYGVIAGAGLLLLSLRRQLGIVRG